LKLNSNANRIYRLVKYEPYKTELETSNPFKRYYGNPLRDRLLVTGDFDNDKASLVLQNITEKDEGLQIFCEIHWGNLYGESYGKVEFEKNEVTKGLSIQDNSCWKGSEDLWLNYRGLKTRTKSGYECQFWNSKSPHNHTATNIPDDATADADHNFCRLTISLRICNQNVRF